MSGPGERQGEREGERHGEGVTDCAAKSEGLRPPAPDDTNPDEFPLPPPAAAATPHAPETPNFGSIRPPVVLRRLMERGGCLPDFLIFGPDMPLSNEVCTLIE